MRKEYISRGAAKSQEDFFLFPNFLLLPAIAGEMTLAAGERMNYNNNQETQTSFHYFFYQEEHLCTAQEKFARI